MNKVTLITGGSRSGKSEFAEKILENEADVLYIATSIITDEEMEERVKKHRDRRKNSWETYEGYKKLDEQIELYKGSSIMLDSVTTMLTNMIFENDIDFEKVAKAEIGNVLDLAKNEFKKFIDKAKEENKNLIMVTDEVGSGLIPEYKLGRIFRDLLGSLNQYIAALCDEVYLVCCGIPLKLK